MIYGKSILTNSQHRINPPHKTSKTIGIRKVNLTAITKQVNPFKNYLWQNQHYD